MDLQELGWRGKDWIDLSHIRDMCQALLNAAMNVGFHKMRGIS
jgi:hypothetical protein